MTTTQPTSGSSQLESSLLAPPELAAPKEVPVSALDARIQKLVENARMALQKGSYEYVFAVSSQVLKIQPACLAVRKLHRAAQMRQLNTGGKRGGIFERARRLLSTCQMKAVIARKGPLQRFEIAESLIANDPTNGTALCVLGKAADALEMFETAAFAFDAAREIEPDNRAWAFNAAEAWLKASNASEALKIAQDLLQAQPTDGEALNLVRKASVAQTMRQTKWESKGSYRDKLRNEEQAVSLEQATKVVASDTMTERLLAEALATVATEPNNLNHYRSISQAYKQLGRLEEALQWVRNARALPVGMADAALEKYESELGATIIEQKVRAAETALQTSTGEPGAAAALESAKRELSEFKIGEAIRYIERYPNDHAARYSLGALLLESGETDVAIAHFQQAQKGPQVRVASLVGLGRAFRMKKLYDLSVTQLNAAKAELSVMDEVKKDVLYELGTCYELMGNPDAAIEDFKAIYSEDIGFRDVAEKIDRFYAARTESASDKA